MSDKALHIVSFAVPYPPNYGGVIDVFYKIKHLYEKDIQIYLHCFTYGNHQPHADIEKYCKKVFYYKRKTGFLQQLSPLPYIVKSRMVNDLLVNLTKDEFPILFEGLHCCGFISHPALKNHLKIYRESNIEHHYYQHLSKATSNIIKKTFYAVEARKLKSFQKKLKYADKMLAVSKSDSTYLKQHFPNNIVKYLPSFHSNEEVNILSGKGNYVLYHGKLSVEENLVAANYIIKHIFSTIDVPLKIAGLNPPASLIKLIDKYPHIELIQNPSESRMTQLIQNAHIHILITFQPTGLKLKLLNTLYKGRHLLVNKHMVNGTDIDVLCNIANTDESFKKEINRLMKEPFDNKDIELRKEILSQCYDNQLNLKNLLHQIFN